MHSMQSSRESLSHITQTPGEKQRKFGADDKLINWTKKHIENVRRKTNSLTRSSSDRKKSRKVHKTLSEPGEQSQRRERVETRRMQSQPDPAQLRKWLVKQQAEGIDEDVEDEVDSFDEKLIIWTKRHVETVRRSQSLRAPSGMEYRRYAPSDVENRRTSQPAVEYRRSASSNVNYHQSAPPAMDYRQGAPAGISYRESVPFDMDYRQGAPPDIDYRQGVPPSMDYRQGAPPAIDYRQGVPPSMDYRQGVPPSMDYRQGAPPDIDYRQAAPLRMNYGPGGELNTDDYRRKWNRSSTYSEPGLAEVVRPEFRKKSHSLPSVRCMRTKEEYAFRQVLQSVVNPLGAPDTRPGFRPLELANHLRQVFEVDPEDHERCVREVQYTKPSNIVLNVTVEEARDIKGSCTHAPRDPYCVLGVVASRTPRGSPRDSPKTSPRSSPTQSRRRRISYEQGEVKRTQTIKSTICPRWKEEFELDAKDIQNEELQVLIWDHNSKAAQESDKLMDKPTGLKSLFRQLRLGVELSKLGEGFIGQCRVPLRDIPAGGMDQWHELYQDKRKKMRAPGQIRLRLQLSVKQSVDQLDSVESDQCSIEDYYHVVQKVYRHVVRQLQSQEQRLSGGGRPPGGAVRTPPILYELPEQDRSIVHQFAVQNHISKLSQLVTELAVLLELSTDEASVTVVAEKLLKDALLDLETELMNHPGQRLEDNFNAEKILTETELHLFYEAATAYVTTSMKRLDRGGVPKLFPPHELQLEELNRKVSMVINVLNLPLWQANGQARKDCSVLLTERLQDDVKAWVHMKLNLVRSSCKDPVIPETKIMVSVLQEASTSITPIYSVTQYFSRLGIDYFKVASLQMDRPLSARCQDLMQHMDQYQVRYHKYRVNIQESSVVSLQLYFCLKDLFNMIKSNISGRELFRISMATYQTWFETAITFWLQTFREECLRRMEKALEIEKDVVQVTSLVKYSNSCVDVISSFSKITSEWRQIDFADADIGILGVTKITDTLCDGARQYVEKVEHILEKNGFYDDIDNQQFDITDQLCISLNNMIHVRKYLYELPKLLNWDLVTQNISIKHENEAVGRQSLRTLHSLIQSAAEDIIIRGRVLWEKIIALIGEDLRKYTMKFTNCQPHKVASVDTLLQYLDSNLQVLYEKLDPSLFPMILEQIWMTFVQVFHDTLMPGQAPEYYKQMLAHVKSVRAYILRGGVNEKVCDRGLYCNTLQQLDMNSQTSEELVRLFYKTLSDNVNTPTGHFYGHLEVKIAYQKETGGNVTVYVKVIRAQHLPGMNRKNLSDPYVSVLLCPTSMFPINKPQKTQVIPSSTDPVFNEAFEFQYIPHEFLKVDGTLAVFSVWNYDAFLPNDFLGEVVVALSDMREINVLQTIDDMPAMILPMKRPVEPTDGPFQVLKDRSENDRLAKFFVHQRQALLGSPGPLKVCAPMHMLISKVRGKKTEVAASEYGIMAI